MFVLLAVPFNAAAAEPKILPETDRILMKLQKARSETGSRLLDRRELLDDVAGSRAADIASRPAGRRLHETTPIGSDLQAAGFKKYRRAVSRLIMLRGMEPVAGVVSKWRGHADAWKTVMSDEMTGIGLGTARADDGWFIFVAVLVEDSPVFSDLKALERKTLRRINRIRKKNRLPILEHDERLSEVARRHAEDMAGRGYMEHDSPEGMNAADRIDAAGIAYSLAAENLHSNNRVLDPVKSAVDGWMASTGHRANILDARFTDTGIGVAVSEDGTMYFVQLFLKPKR